jgi:D-beta-D-heptose 7-phosphate kinase/D-beta-D-heptose 1-phosphate adenosyltransferase
MNLPKKVLVVGETCWDISLNGHCTRICPEGPVPILSVINPLTLLDYEDRATLGMAGNVSANLMHLGCNVETITNEVVKPFKIRFFDEVSGNLMFRADLADKVVDKFDRDRFKKACEEDLVCIVVSDYDKGFLSEQDLQWMAALAAMKEIPIYVDTKKPVNNTTFWEFTLVKINLLEYTMSRRVTGKALDKLANLVVTTGSDGCTMGVMRYKQKQSRDVRDVCGAGDTFLAALAIQHALTKDIKRAIDFANLCAGSVVEHHGVVPVDISYGEQVAWTSSSPAEPDSSDPQ